MQKIAFGICWWNDPSIFRTLESIPKEFKKIVVDGKFKFVDSPNILSDEKLRDRVKNYTNTELIDAPNLLEPEKRNVYLNNMYDYKYGFLIDSDEYIKEANWSNFFKTLSDFGEGLHQLIIENGNDGQVFPRVWVNPAEWEYYKCHCVFRNKKTCLIEKTSKVPGKLIEDVVIGENDELREENYVKLLDSYQDKLMRYEKQWKKYLLVH